MANVARPVLLPRNNMVLCMVWSQPLYNSGLKFSDFTCGIEVTKIKRKPMSSMTNLLSSAPFGVLMQCVFAASLGTLFAAIYFRTGNLWVTVFLHGAMDIASMLVGGLYGTEDVAESISGYDASMMLSILIYLIPTLFLLRKKKIGEVALYFGRDCAPAAAPAPEENGERLR